MDDQSLVVVDGDGLRVISNNRTVLRNENTGVLGVYIDDGIVTGRGRVGGRREEERREIEEGEEGANGEERRGGEVGGDGGG